MNIENLKEAYETGHHTSDIVRDILMEISDLPCPNSYGFEGPGTFSDCGKCIICLSKEFVKYYEIKEQQGTTMKQKKPLKMYVPESGVLKYFDGGAGMENKILSREQIHELVKGHAEKFGYTFYNNFDDTSSHIFIDDNNLYYHDSDPDWNNERQEISWQDFLKLTPGDVQEGYPIEKASKSFDAYIEQHTQDKPELTQEEIDILTFKQPTTDRNEKAWDLYVALIASGWLNRSNSENLFNHIDRLINDFDNRLKQAGNK